MEVNLSTKSRETLLALLQSRTGVSGRNSGSDALEKSLSFVYIKGANIVACRWQFSNK